jgi:hypothetical protein
MNKEDRLKEFRDIMSHTGCPIEVIEGDLDRLGFFTAPASTKYHGAYEGGLFDHSLETTKALVELTEKLGLEWEHKRSPYVVGMLHDLCKCDAYAWDIENDKYGYSREIIIPGHGDKSVILAMKYFELTDEEIACIRWHMGAYERDPKMWEYYGRAIERFPNVLYTHTADMIASKIRGV